MLPALSDKELDRLEDLLITYGNDYSVLNLAELHGFLTALASSPVNVIPEKWLPVVAGGKVPKFKRPAHAEAYTALLLRFANEVTEDLAYDLDHFEPIFEQSTNDEAPTIIMEEWCFGYMRGTQLAGWQALPEEQDALLKDISLHGLEDNFELLDALSFEEHQAYAPRIVKAARALYRFHKQPSA